MEAATNRRREVTDAELREAEKGLVRLLHKKRFPREWIEQNVPDVMAQARTDFAARLAAGKEDDTVNLLVVIGYRRALKVLDAQLSRPSTTSIETMFHLADESTPTPEEEAIEHDREERVLKALESLPERERRLMAFVYFDGKSVREAGRRLGWGKSSADRHHQAALEKLHDLLDRSLLSPEIAIPAYAAARHWHHSPVRAFEHWMAGAGETVTEGAVMAGGRFGQAAEGASAAASSGAGRTAAGVCGAAVAVCLTGAATGVVGPGVGVIHLGQHPAPHAHHRGAGHNTATPEPPVTTTDLEPPQPEESSQPTSSPTPQGGAAGSNNATPQTPTTKSTENKPRESDSRSSASTATHKETVDEFGVESGEVQSVPESSTTSEPAPAEESAPAPATRPSGESSAPPPPSGSSGGGGSTQPEFGM
jgi:RNA polymerase sigma factor (sigma-70 family)